MSRPEADTEKPDIPEIVFQRQIIRGCENGDVYLYTCIHFDESIPALKYVDWQDREIEISVGSILSLAEMLEIRECSKRVRGDSPDEIRVKVIR